MHKARFSAQEFQILWSAYGRDRLPYPLRFRPATSDFYELKQDRERAVESLLAKYDPSIERALDTLVNPAARIESKGFAGHDNSRIIRFYGAIRDTVGATLDQEPGPSGDNGGAVVLSYGTADEVADSAVATLPAREPGTRAPIEVRRERIAAEDEYFEFRVGALSAVDQLDLMFGRPRSAYGEIAAYAGGALDARPSASVRTFWWMDYPDGRYYVRTGDPIIAEPLDSARMTAGIRAMLHRAQRQHSNLD
ncbi:ESX secretion-associated protein EspG [Nocardia sp. NPDC058666]|uniref:ESX secretion-associated protein EspG n=1 Tax=unclassified Nocardia TaxID=2637762 RepID=UPI00365AFE43